MSNEGMYCNDVMYWDVVTCVDLKRPGYNIYKHINNSAGCGLSRLDYGHDSTRYDFSLQTSHRDVMIINIPSPLSHCHTNSLTHNHNHKLPPRTGKKYKTLRLFLSEQILTGDNTFKLSDYYWALCFIATNETIRPCLLAKLDSFIN